jgi:O-antigen ligase
VHLILLLPASMLGLLVLVVCVRRPVATIVPVYAALVPFGDVFSLRVPLPKPFNSLSSVVGALTIVALILHLLLERRGRVPTLPVGLWLAFLGWGALTFMWAQDPTNVAHEILIAAPLLLLLVLVSMVKVTRAELYRVRDAIVLSGAGVGAYGLLLMAAGRNLPAHGLTDRFSVAANPSNTNPNQLAAALLLPAMLAIGIVLEGHPEGTPRWRPWFGGVSAVLTAFAMAISGSRGGALAGVVGFVTLLVLWYRWRPWQRDRVRRVVAGTALGGAVVIVLLAIVVVLFPQGKVASVVTNGPLQRLTETSSTSGRAEIWTTGAIACRTYCAVGAGMANFPIVYSQVVAFSDVTRNVGVSRPGHNLYLETLVEMGVVGFTLFWIAIGSEFRSLRARRYEITAAIVAAIVAILLADFFEAFLWFKHAWLPFMMVRLVEGVYAAEPVREAIGRFRAPATTPSLPPTAQRGIEGTLA